MATEVTSTKSYKAMVMYKGGETTYSFPFLYLKKQFVKVRYVDSSGNYTELNYASDYTVEEKTIVLSSAGSSDDNIVIYRQTPTDQIVDYVDATVLQAYHLNTNQIQILHILEEQYDTVLSASTDNYTYDANGMRIQNLADPVSNQDAVTKKWFEEWNDKYALLLDSNKENWEAENRRIQNVSDPSNGQDAVTLSYLSNYIDKIGVDSILIDDFFDIDVNGGLEPAVSPTYSRDWELDSNGDVMPKLEVNANG